MAKAAKKAAVETAPAVATDPLPINADHVATMNELLSRMDGTPDGYMLVDLSKLEPLVQRGFLRTNPDIVNGSLTAAVLSQEGIDFLQNTPKAGADVVDTAPKPVMNSRPLRESAMDFQIVSDFTPPAVTRKRGGTNRDAYPFDQLAVGQSF